MFIVAESGSKSISLTLQPLNLKTLFEQVVQEIKPIAISKKL
jgi:hypothetical protein